MAGSTVATIIEIIKRKHSITMGGIEPPVITRDSLITKDSFEDGFNMGTLYINEVKRILQQSQTPLQTNCPNCGAPLENGKCSYCGTHVYHTVSMDDITPYMNEGYKIHKVS